MLQISVLKYNNDKGIRWLFKTMCHFGRRGSINLPAVTTLGGGGSQRKYIDTKGLALI